MRKARWGLCVPCLVILGACAPASEESPEVPEWQLIEDLVIGSLEGGPDEHTFGMVDELLGMPDGGVVVADVQAVEVTRFGSLGEKLGQLGSKGEGPGEYLDLSGLGLMPDGGVLVRDSRRALIFYTADGSLRGEWPIRVDFVGDDPVSIVGDTVLLRFISGPRSLETFWHSRSNAFLRAANGEVIDTIFPAPYTQTGLFWAPYHAQFHLDWLGNGAQLRGAGTESLIQVTSPEASSAVLLDSLPSVPLPAAAQREIEEHRAWLERRGNRAAPFYPELPADLPVFGRVLISASDQLWVERPLPDIRYRMDIYEADGSALATVLVPSGLEIRSVREDWVWGVRRGEYDEQYVVRHRIDRR